MTFNELRQWIGEEFGCHFVLEVKVWGKLENQKPEWRCHIDPANLECKRLEVYASSCAGLYEILKASRSAPNCNVDDEVGDVC